MIDWFVHTLRSYPEIAIFLSLALGYYFGSFTYKGLGLGAVTATLIAAVIIGQLGITISGPLKPTFFLISLFAIGYRVGPQFVRGIAADGVPQALFAAVVCVFWNPWGPVQALAPPELRITASTRPSLTTSRDQCTGAAATRLDVKTAAAALDGPSLTTRATSGLPEALSPAVTPAARNPCGAVILTVRLPGG